MKPGLLLRAVRAPSLTAGAMPVVVTLALVDCRRAPIRPAVAAATLIGMVAAQAAVNVLNDYFDDRSGLDADPDFADSRFPLGSRVLQRGELGRRAFLALGASLVAVAVLCGVWIDARSAGHWVASIMGLAGALGYFYTAPPLRLAYRGLGEPVIFLLFGPLAGLGTWYAQVQSFDLAQLVPATSVGWLATAILFLHHFPQRHADGRHGKMTPVVRLGAPASGRLTSGLLALAYVTVLAGCALGRLPALTAIVLLTLPLAIRVGRVAWTRPDDDRAMMGAFGGVLVLHLVFGLLLAGALVVAGRWPR